MKQHHSREFSRWFRKIFMKIYVKSNLLFTTMFMPYPWKFITDAVIHFSTLPSHRLSLSLDETKEISEFSSRWCRLACGWNFVYGCVSGKRRFMLSHTYQLGDMDVSAIIMLGDDKCRKMIKLAQFGMDSMCKKHQSETH